MIGTREVWTLVLFCLVYISWGLTDSIQAPFYPIEAESKGAKVAEYGFVFGIIHLAIFISGPLFGKYMHKMGVKNVYIFGVISTGVCALLFGFLDFVNDKNIFLAYSYLLRVLEGIAEAASWSAVFSMLLQMFPKNVATVYSFTEASFSFSEMVGPTVGALLYSIGGFILPFELCGVLCLVTGLMTIFVIPDNLSKTKSREEVPLHPDSILSNGHVTNSEMETTDKATSNKTQIWPVLSNVDVLLALSGTVYAAAVQGLLEACLEPYLEQFHLSITKIGFTFLALSVPYFMASPLWGYFCDHLIAPEYVQMTGNLIVICGFLVLGPAPYLPFPPNYPTLVIGLSFLGIGTAAGLVASFSGAQKAALAKNPDNASHNEIYPAISGIWTSSFALGNFLGPSVGGILFDLLDFRNTTMIFQIVGFLLLFIDSLRIYKLRNNVLIMKKVNSERVDLYERL